MRAAPQGGAGGSRRNKSLRRRPIRQPGPGGAGCPQGRAPCAEASSTFATSYASSGTSSGTSSRAAKATARRTSPQATANRIWLRTRSWLPRLPRRRGGCLCCVRLSAGLPRRLSRRTPQSSGRRQPARYCARHPPIPHTLPCPPSCQRAQHALRVRHRSRPGCRQRSGSFVATGVAKLILYKGRARWQCWPKGM